MKVLKCFMLLLAVFCLSFSVQAGDKEDDKKLFEKVSSRLDKGGSFFQFQSNKYLFRAIENTYKQIPAAIKVIVPNQQQQLMSLMIYNFLEPLAENFGADEMLAGGASSILIAEKTAKTPALFRSRQFIYYGDKKVQGLVWNFIHEENIELTELASLPKETLFASASQVTPGRIWNKIKLIFATISFMPAKNALILVEQSFFNRFQIKLADFLESLSGTWSSVLVQAKNNDSKDALFLMLKIPNKNNLAFRILSKIAQSQKDLKVSSDEITMTKTFALKWLKPCIRRDDKNIYIVSNVKILEMFKDTIAKKNGLVSSTEFKHLRQGLGEKGVAFVYFNQKVIDVAINIIKTNNANKQDWSALAKLLPPSSLFMLVSKEKDGIMYSMNSPMDLPQIVTYTSFFPTLVRLAMLANAPKASRPICISKLKKISLALKMYAMNHKDKYPEKNNVAGLNELIKAELLSDFSVFVCPGSKITKALGKELKEENNSYIYLGGFTEGDGANIPLVFDKLDTKKRAINIVFQDGRLGAFANKFRSCKDLIAHLAKIYPFKPKVLKKLQEKAIEVDEELGYK